MGLRVAYQGERGAYSEAAAAALHGDRIEPVPLQHFDDVFAAVAKGQADRGVIPIENSLTGSIHRNYDLLLRHELNIVGERVQRIEHCLLAPSGTALEAVRRVYSHPQALQQCETFLRGLPKAETLPTTDTAGAARLVAQSRAGDAAAVASRLAADIHGLAVLAANVEDDPENYTRFLSLAREPAPPPVPQAKTSIAFALPHEAGALVKALGIFALWGINMTKLESRPIRGKPWQYLFYLDFQGAAEDEPCQRALRHLTDYAELVRVFGSYPASDALQ